MRSFIFASIVLFIQSGVSLAQWCQGINGPYWCGDPDHCAQCAASNWSCDRRCTAFGGMTMTCGEFRGNPAHDLDNDGVANNSDSCRCTPNPNQFCASNVQQCGQGNYVFHARTMQLCHIDPDLHFDGVDVEIYTADSYRDASCYQYANRFRKRLASSVHCGFHSKSTCKKRVAKRIGELAAQGYQPPTSDDELDRCPRPRI